MQINALFFDRSSSLVLWRDTTRASELNEARAEILIARVATFHWKEKSFVLIKSDLCEIFLEIYKFGWVSEVFGRGRRDGGFGCKNSSIDLYYVEKQHAYEQMCAKNLLRC